MLIIPTFFLFIFLGGVSFSFYFVKFVVDFGLLICDFFFFFFFFVFLITDAAPRLCKVSRTDRNHFGHELSRPTRVCAQAGI
jgi:hypothetical protein